TVNGQPAFTGSRASVGHVLHFRRAATGQFEPGFPEPPEGALEKRPGLGGPITDAYFDRMVHVYGTGVPEHTEALRRAAQKGAQGWPVWLWGVEQQVVADTEVDASLTASAHLVLYGTQRDNAVLDRIEARLPIRVLDAGLQVGDQRYEGAQVGTRFIYLNPEAPNRYVIVQAGASLQAVSAGHHLADFVPDYVVYDGRRLPARQRLISGRSRMLDMGYFDDAWRLPGAQDATPRPPRGALPPEQPQPDPEGERPGKG